MKAYLPFIYLFLAALIAGAAYYFESTFVPYVLAVLLVLLALECSDRR